MSKLDLDEIEKQPSITQEQADRISREANHLAGYMEGKSNRLKRLLKILREKEVQSHPISE